MDIKDIITRIGYFRNRANLSAKALSLSIGKSHGYISKMEHGDHIPSMEVMLEILEACETTPEEFFYESLDEYKTDKEILSLIKKVDEKKKSALKNFLIEMLK